MFDVFVSQVKNVPSNSQLIVQDQLFRKKSDPAVNVIQLYDKLSNCKVLMKLQDLYSYVVFCYKWLVSTGKGPIKQFIYMSTAMIHLTKHSKSAKILYFLSSL